MREPLTTDDLEALEEQASGSPDAQRETARRLQRDAADPHPEDEVSPVDVLNHAAELLALAGDQEPAIEVLWQAVSLDHPADLDPRCLLVLMLVQGEQLDEARAVTSALRARRPSTPASYLLLGEAWELAGEAGEAARWFTAGVLAAERAGEPMLQLLALSARRRLRQALGIPADDFDMQVDRLREMAQEHQHHDRD